MRSLLLFLAVLPALAQPVFLAGYETGGTTTCSFGANTSVQASTVLTGAYSLKAGATSTCSSKFTAQANTSVSFRFRKAANPSSDTAVFLLTAGANNRVAINLRTTGKMSVSGSTVGITTTTGTTTLSNDTTYLVRLVYAGAAGGVVKLWIDSTLDVNITHTNDYQDITGFSLAGTASPSDTFFDDIVVWSSSSQAFDTKVIARQPTSGTPTYNAWTKSSGTIDTVWAETPYSATNYATSNVLNDAQTALIATFASTQTGHGSEVIQSYDTIDGCKVGAVMKSATQPRNISLRRRLGGTDTDSVISVTSTSDAYYETAIWTASYANLNSMEAGAVQGSNTIVQTVEDIWVMCAYTGGSGITRSRIIQIGE